MGTYVVHALGYLATIVDFCTGVAIGVGVFSTIVRAAKLALISGSRSTDSVMSEIRMNLGSWLALGLELALAADVLRTVVVPTWDEIGKLAAIVVVRTVLNYFLAREIQEGQKRAA